MLPQVSNRRRWLYQSMYSRVAISTCSAVRQGPRGLISSVGWARNHYWAVQIWGVNGYGYGYRNGCDPLEAAADAPSLDSLGWPHPLSYADTLGHAKRLSKRPVMVSADYRMTDGGSPRT